MSYALFFTLTGKTCATIYPRPHSKFNNLKLSGKKTYSKNKSPICLTFIASGFNNSQE